MLIFTTIKQLKTFLATQNKTVVLVPTMGSLHFGHLSLVKHAKEIAEIAVVSIFVNKKQFNNLQDYQSYPKNLSADLKLLQEQNVDVVFAPSDLEILPENQDYFTISPAENLENCLCGKFRPKHFAGVCLIIVKLFNIVKPNFAIFGEKDFQQLTIIKKIVEYFNFDLQIIASPTIRNNNGLALSSRNALLSENGLLIASNIYQALLCVAQNPTHINNISDNLLTKGFSKVEYLEIRDSQDLSLINPNEISLYNKTQARIFIAAVLENVRLIDNLIFTN
jgi:pantoate--beta-alanine ligase